MPRRFRSSFSKRVRFARRRKYSTRKRYARRMANKKNGYVRVIRKTPEQTLVNGVSAGTISNTSTGIITVGAPVSAGFTNYFNVPCSALFTLNDIYNASDITNIADKYKIAWVKIKVYSTSTIASAASTAQLPSIIWSVDEDDNTMPTVAQLKEKMNAKQRMFYPGKPVSIFIRNPRIVRQLDTSAGAYMGNEVTPAKFINCSQPNVPHYGLKMALLDANLSSTSTAYTQFKFDLTYCIIAKDLQ